MLPSEYPDWSDHNQRCNELLYEIVLWNMYELNFDENWHLVMIISAVLIWNLLSAYMCLHTTSSCILQKSFHRRANWKENSVSESEMKLKVNEIVKFYFVMLDFAKYKCYFRLGIFHHINESTVLWTPSWFWQPRSVGQC